MMTDGTIDFVFLPGEPPARLESRSHKRCVLCVFAPRLKHADCCMPRAPGLTLYALCALRYAFFPMPPAGTGFSSEATRYMADRMPIPPIALNQVSPSSKRM